MQVLFWCWITVMFAVILAFSLCVFVQALKEGSLDGDSLQMLSTLLLFSPLIPAALAVFLLGYLLSRFVKIPFYEKFDEALRADLQGK